MQKNELYFSRELSWLSFNYRVLQEAKDENVPLLERLRFIAIYSSNLDEFFRVRVTSLRSLLELNKRNLSKIEIDPERILAKINKQVEQHQKEFNTIYHEELIPALRKDKIFILDESNLSKEEEQYCATYFRERAAALIKPTDIQAAASLQIENKQIYLAVVLKPRPVKLPVGSMASESTIDAEDFFLVEVPTQQLGRFIMLPSPEDEQRVILLDDVIRLMLPEIFAGYAIEGSYCIKLTRDAELDLGDEFEGDLRDKIKKSLAKRKTGLPSRLLYDAHIPDDLLKLLRKKLDITKDDLIGGGRYHNFSDFLGFPFPQVPNLSYETLPPIPKKELEITNSMFNAIDARDILLYYPCHSYSPVSRLLNEAADDPTVQTIYITLYRVARKSEVVLPLIRAVENGKEVIVFDEIKARFDEESNIYWAERLEQAGAKVLYSIPELKVHAKMLLIKRTIGTKNKNYAYLSTGNFNEKTSLLYTDYGLFTADTKITKEVDYVFEILQDMRKKREFKHLLVAPDFMRKDLFNLIDNEIKNHLKGKPAGIIMKINNLEDRELIDKLYEASQDGVKIKLIVRSACCLIPGVHKVSENIEVTSIIDRYLEHARVLIFRNAGNDTIYLSSADMMNRNLSRRFEVAFPVYDKKLKKFILDIMSLHLNDNVKARIIDRHQINQYKRTDSDVRLRSQIEIYNYVKSLETNYMASPVKEKTEG